MDYPIIRARAHRNHLVKLAGEHFCDRTHETVIALEKQGKVPYLGIQNNDGLYSIVGRDCSYVRTDSGVCVDLTHDDFLKILGENGMKKGKGADFEFLDLGSYGKVWLKDGQTMCALWNVILCANRKRA